MVRLVSPCPTFYLAIGPTTMEAPSVTSTSRCVCRKTNKNPSLNRYRKKIFVYKIKSLYIDDKNANFSDVSSLLSTCVRVHLLLYRELLMKL